MKNFWQNLAQQKKPFFALAPMEAAADTVFRRIVAHAGKPDVFFTEFTNVEGLFSKGAKKVERRLNYTEIERPLIAQIWGLNPEYFYKAALQMQERGFDGIDLNMGCPEASLTARGACSALIKNKPLAMEIIDATKRGAEDAAKARILALRDKGELKNKNEEEIAELREHLQMPVSVKTRIGFTVIQTEEWAGFLLEQDIDALTIHGRTRKEMSKVPAHWDEIAKVVNIRNQINIDTVILGNGDVKSIEEGTEKSRAFGVDGIMIGRGVFENAWLFNDQINPLEMSIENRLDILQKHLTAYEQEVGEKLPYQTLKKYYKIYIRDFDGAGELRAKLMTTNSLDEAKEVLQKESSSILVA